MKHAGYPSFKKPMCRTHDQSYVRRDHTGKWVCFACADDWFLTKQGDSSTGGVALPAGVRDERLSFSALFPNRRARRAKR